MKLIPTLLLTLTASFTSLKADPSAPQAQQKPDPIVGRWRYFNGPIATLSEDGKAVSSNGSKGAWKFVASPEVERKYRLNWKDGIYIDDMVLSNDGKRLVGRNVKKQRIWADRVEP